MLTPKGTRRHRRFGLAYVAADAAAERHDVVDLRPVWALRPVSASRAGSTGALSCRAS